LKHRVLPLPVERQRREKIPENPIWRVSHPHSPKNPPHCLLAIHIPFMVNSKLHLFFPGVVVVGMGLIIRIKANTVCLD